MKEKFILWIVWHLPRVVIMWATIRLMSHAISGEYQGQDAAAITCIDALKRWDDQ